MRQGLLGAPRASPGVIMRPGALRGPAGSSDDSPSAPSTTTSGGPEAGPETAPPSRRASDTGVPEGKKSARGRPSSVVVKGAGAAYGLEGAGREDGYATVLAVSEEPLHGHPHAPAAGGGPWDPALGPFSGGPRLGLAPGALRRGRPPLRKRLAGRLGRLLAPLVSIRALFVLSAVAGAIAFSWGIAYYFGERSVEELSGAHVRALERESVAATEHFLAEAAAAARRVAAELAAGRATRDRWRPLLELLSSAALAAPQVPAPSLRTPALLLTGGCAAAGAPRGPRPAVRGRPLARGGGGSVSGDLWAPLDLGGPGGPSLTYLAAARGGTPLSHLLGGSGGGGAGPAEATPGPGAAGTPEGFFQAAAGEAGGGAGAVAAAAAVRVPLAAVAARLAAAVSVPGSLLAPRPPPAGRRLLTAHGRSGEGLVRELCWGEGAAAAPDEVRVVHSAGRAYWAHSAPVRAPAPGLEWRLWAAVPKDGVAAGMGRAATLNTAFAAAWLVLCVAAAAGLGWRITRPIEKLRASMSILLETMTRVSAELRLHVRAPGPEGSVRKASLPGRRGSAAPSTRSVVAPTTAPGSPAASPPRPATPEAGAEEKNAGGRGRAGRGLRELSDFESIMATRLSFFAHSSLSFHNRSSFFPFRSSGPGVYM
eukprot:tig00000498_g1653.t1